MPKVPRPRRVKPLLVSILPPTHPDVEVASKRVMVPLDTHEGRLTAGFYLGALRMNPDGDTELVAALAEGLRATKERS